MTGSGAVDRPGAYDQGELCSLNPSQKKSAPGIAAVSQARAREADAWQLTAHAGAIMEAWLDGDLATLRAHALSAAAVVGRLSAAGLEAGAPMFSASTWRSIATDAAKHTEPESMGAQVQPGSDTLSLRIPTEADLETKGNAGVENS